MSNHLRNQAIRATGPDSGFKLFKVVAVVAILGILCAIAVPTLRGLTPTYSPRTLAPKARRTKIDADSKNILTVAESLHDATRRYPGTIAEMVDAKDENGADAEASLYEMPKDPWGSDYLYEIVNGRPRVTCLGADKQPGGSDGEAVDIINWASSDAAAATADSSGVKP